MKIAGIGCGTSGMVAYEKLEEIEGIEIHAYEKNSYIGGHVYSGEFTNNGKVKRKVHIQEDQDVEESSEEELTDGNEETIIVEQGTGFINEQFYPELMAFFKKFGIKTELFTLTSHFVNREAKLDLYLPPFYHDDAGKFKVEWGTLLSFKNIKILVQMALMLRQAEKILLAKHNTKMTLKEFLDQVSFLGIHLSEQFKNDFIYPLLASAFFIDKDSGISIANYSALSVLNFPLQGSKVKDNKWLKVKEGLSTNIKRIEQACSKTTFHTNTEITAIERITKKSEAPQYKLKDSAGEYLCDEEGNHLVFDGLILALPANQCAKLLQDVPGMSKVQKAAAQIVYHPTNMVFHYAKGSSSGLRRTNTSADNQSITFTDPTATIKILKTANPPEGSISEDKIVDRIYFEHPVLDGNFHAYGERIARQNKKIAKGEKPDPCIEMAGIAADGDDGNCGAIRAGDAAAEGFIDRANQGFFKRHVEEELVTEKGEAVKEKALFFHTV